MPTELPTPKSELARQDLDDRAVRWALAAIEAALDCGIPERLIRGILQPEPLDAMIDCAKRNLRDEYAALAARASKPGQEG